MRVGVVVNRTEPNTWSVLSGVVYNLPDVRWDIRDGVCLCVKHHRFGIESAHEDPLWFREWLEDKRWEDYAYLYTVKNQIKKWTLEDMEEQLEELNNIINEK